MSETKITFSFLAASEEVSIARLVRYSYSRRDLIVRLAKRRKDVYHVFVSQISSQGGVAVDGILPYKQVDLKIAGYEKRRIGVEKSPYPARLQASKNARF